MALFGLNWRRRAQESRPSRKLRVENLEDRRVLAAPSLYPGTPLQLPQTGAWQQTPFVGSPIFADLDNNGTEELITAAAGGRLIAFSANGGTPSVFRTYETGSNANFKSTPIVLTLPDGRKAIFAGLGRDESNPGSVESDKIYGWDAVTGQLLPGWPATMLRNVANQGGVTGPIASGDLTGDGIPEIVVTAFSHYVDVFRLDGSLLWRYNADDTIVSGAVVGDLDRDGRNEVVFGSDTSDNGFFTAGGFINILDNTGHAKYRHAVGEVVWSSPVLADLTGDGYLEVVVGTGLNFDDFDPKPGARAAGNRVYAINYQGETVPGWPYHTTNNDNLKRQVLSSPAVADINQDGSLEIIVADRGGFLHVIQSNGQALTGWVGGKQIATQSAPQDGYASPIVADIDGDGSPDIVASNGPNLTGFNAWGNVILQHVTNDNPPDARFNAAAVGQWDGVGGLELVSVSNVSAVPNRPSDVTVWQLDASTLVAPWPMHRRSADGVAVTYHRGYLETYVHMAYSAFLDRTPSTGEVNFLVGELLNNNVSLFELASYQATSQESRDIVINQLYSQLLNRNPDPGGRAFWQGYLATNTVKQMALFMITLPEYFARGGGTNAGVVQLMYQTVLNRTAGTSEVDPWVQEINRIGLANVARNFWHSDENLTNKLTAFYQKMTGSTHIEPDDLSAALLDKRFGRRREEDIFANILASNGNYAATNNVVQWTRTLYRDVLGREAAPIEVAMWLNAVQRGEVGLNAIAAVMVNTPEARGRTVTMIFEKYLGRTPGGGEITSLLNYSNREQVIQAVVTSPEYFTRNGSSAEGYIRGVFRDLAGIDPLPQVNLNQWINFFNTGTPASQLPQLLMQTREYFNKQIVDMMFEYLPDESQGVLRSGNLPPWAPNQPINPNPDIVNFFVNLRTVGVTADQVLVELLSSPQYVACSSYYKGFYRSTGVRN